MSAETQLFLLKRKDSSQYFFSEDISEGLLVESYCEEEARQIAVDSDYGSGPHEWADPEVTSCELFVKTGEARLVFSVEVF